MFEHLARVSALTESSTKLKSMSNKFKGTIAVFAKMVSGGIIKASKRFGTVSRFSLFGSLD